MTRGVVNSIDRVFRRGAGGGGRKPDVKEADAADSATLSNLMERHADSYLKYLAAIRFVAFAMGTGLVYGTTDLTEVVLPTTVAVIVAGAYNILIVAGRPYIRGYERKIRWATIAAELPLAVTLVLLTDALDSPFLIYSLVPILTISLLTGPRSALLVSVITALSIIGGHIAGGLGVGDYPWILQGNYLAFSLLYAAVCLLTSYLPFLSNLNWHRRVRMDSLISERQRLRREVHDNIAQTLAFLSLKAKRAEERAVDHNAILTTRDVSEIAGAVEQAYLSVRDYLDGAEDRQGTDSLGPRLIAAAREWSREAGVPVKIEVTGQELGLTAREQTQLFQIAAEALANVRKHASPANVWVSLTSTPSEIRLQIKDDGRGFGISQPHGHGLTIMRERARMVGAHLEVSSAPGKGTLVAVTRPREGQRAPR